jgi:integral membrane protein
LATLGRVPDFADDPSSELERKAKALSIVSLVETVSYLLLFYFWQIGKSDAGTAIVGSVHGMIWLTFCAMVIMITPAMRWSWWYTALAIVTGPVGALLVWFRLRREGVPDQYAGDPGAAVPPGPASR